MFSAGTLTFQEFMAHEKLPLATIQNAVLEFLRGRDDAVVFGAQAVNAYVKEPRTTQDLDLVSTRPIKLACELQEFLIRKFKIFARMRKFGSGSGCQVYQVVKFGNNRHLVDIRPVVRLPQAKRISQVLMATPEELIASKVIAYHHRRGKPKAGDDWRDLAMLLLKFPELKRESGPVLERLQAAEADPAILAVWNELVTQEITPANEDDEF
jgi:hypothetical protein